MFLLANLFANMNSKRKDIIFSYLILVVQETGII